jgi:hypothetical protein
MTFSRAEIENRIRQVLGYNGTQDIASVIVGSLRRHKVYRADWILACACMTPAEYIEFGNKGEEWQFLVSHPEGEQVANRAIQCMRKIIEERCAEIGYDACNWELIK